MASKEHPKRLKPSNIFQFCQAAWSDLDESDDESEIELNIDTDGDDSFTFTFELENSNSETDPDEQRSNYRPPKSRRVNLFRVIHSSDIESQTCLALESGK